MTAGTLRHYVDIYEKQGTTPDGFGNVQVAWVSIHSNVPASVEPYQAKEQFQAGQVQTISYFRVTMRYLSGLTDKHSVRWNGRTFTINGVTNQDERNIMMTLTCTEDVSS